MQLWHLTPDTPHHFNAGEQTTVRIGTTPSEANKKFGYRYGCFRLAVANATTASWALARERGEQQLREAVIGPFAGAERILHRVHGRTHPDGGSQDATGGVHRGSRIHLALL